MKYSFAGFGMIMVGLFSFVIIMVFQSITINNEADYYSLKEAMEASLYESIDIPYYRSYKSSDNIKIVEEKFIENFTRRFVKNTMGNSNGYVLEFYDIMESPPKATVVIKNKTDSMSLTDDANFDVVNSLTGILVHKATEESSCEHSYETSYYYSYVERSNSNSSCTISNKNSDNLGGTGQLLRAYSVERDSNYTYSYDLVNYDYSFHNICFNSGNDIKGDEGKALYTLYQDFVSNDICGYPFYSYSGGNYYLYPQCASKVIDIENGGTDFMVTTDAVNKINFDNYVSKYSKYLKYSAFDVDVVYDRDIKIEKATSEQIKTASNGQLSEANNLYFISWSGSCKKQNTSSGFCSGYQKDNVLMVLEILWDVTKCKK